MNSITPYILTKGNEENPLASEDYKIEQSGEFNIVYKDILADPSIDVDGLTNELRASFKTLENVEGKIYHETSIRPRPKGRGLFGSVSSSPTGNSDLKDGVSTVVDEPHVLVREAVRGNLVDGAPCGYVVELTQDGPTVHALDQMDSVPLLVGYGSLLDPAELACNTEAGDLRNLLDFEAKSELAEEKGITKKISYAEISGLELQFNRVPTAKRHGATQEERSYWAVLNSRPVEDKNAYVVLFDPEDLTENPMRYFARENFDEGVYARRRIEPDQVNIIGGSELPLDKGIWVLDSPLIADIDGRLHVITSKPDSEIPVGYTNMITNGLAGAEQVVPGFAKNYVASVIQANGQPLSDNEEFMGALEQKLPVGALSYFGKNPVPDHAPSGTFEA